VYRGILLPKLGRTVLLNYVASNCCIS